jgi:hypothetical protein
MKQRVLRMLPVLIAPLIRRCAAPSPASGEKDLERETPRPA